MSVIRNINNFIGLFLTVISQFSRIRIWLLLSVIFFIHWLVLFAHYKFYSPAFYGLISNWIEVNDQFARGFIHYPGHFLLLPFYFGWAKLIIGTFFEGAILGAVAFLFYDQFSREVSPSLLKSNRFLLWLNLVFAWLVLNSLLVLVNYFLPELMKSFLIYSPRRQVVFNYMFMPFLYVMIMAVFYYTIPIIAIYRRNSLKAIKASFKMFLRHPIATIAMAFVVLLAPVLISFINNAQDIIVDKFSPEMVYYLLLIGLVIDIPINFLWMGTATAYLVEKE